MAAASAEALDFARHALGHHRVSGADQGSGGDGGFGHAGERIDGAQSRLLGVHRRAGVPFCSVFGARECSSALTANFNSSTRNGLMR